MDRMRDEVDTHSPPAAKDSDGLSEDAENKEDEENHGSRLHEYESRNYLVKTLLDARAVLRNEPASSLRLVLKPSANNLKAHYNALRRSTLKNSGPGFSAILSDYWACWVLLHAISNDLPLEPNLPKYCSNRFRPKVVSFIKLVNSMGLATQASSS